MALELRMEQQTVAGNRGRGRKKDVVAAVKVGFDAKSLLSTKFGSSRRG